MNRAAIADILLRIVDQRRERLSEAQARLSEAPRLEVGARPLTPGENPFLEALVRRRHRRAVIAEVKMGSPSLGSLVGRFDPVEQAKTYADNGAAALSVVVEPDFFHGSYELLAACATASGLPAIAKDFLVDDLQLVWAKEAGASAFLLIAALHTAEELRHYAAKIRALGLVPLVETHDEDDAAKLGSEPWELVGVNNRDLRTFEVSIENSLAMLPRLPSSAVKVAESGLKDAATMARLKDAGFDAFLIGESLLLADDPAAKLADLVAMGRVGGGGGRG